MGLRTQTPIVDQFDCGGGFPLVSECRRRIFPRMATIVRCNCGAEYKRTEAKFLVPHTGHASCKVCGATLESWLESTHVATFELVKRPDGKPGSGSV
jgi:hypothetical protein